MVSLLQVAVHGKRHVIVSGGTGSGNTTPANALSG